MNFNDLFNDTNTFGTCYYRQIFPEPIDSSIGFSSEAGEIPKVFPLGPVQVELVINFETKRLSWLITKGDKTLRGKLIHVITSLEWPNMAPLIAEYLYRTYLEQVDKTEKESPPAKTETYEF